MKLCDYAKNYSVTYRTAWNRFNAGKIPNSFKDKDGHILIYQKLLFMQEYQVVKIRQI